MRGKHIFYMLRFFGIIGIDIKMTKILILVPFLEASMNYKGRT
jgi:hypothetical protein